MQRKGYSVPTEVFADESRVFGIQSLANREGLKKTLECGYLKDELKKNLKDQLIQDFLKAQRNGY